MTVVKTSNHHLYDVDASIYSNGNEKDNMILHYHQNPSANIIKNKSTNIFYATNLHFFYHTDGHVFLFTRRVAENNGFSFFTRRVTDGHGEVVRIVVCLEISVIFRGAPCECHDWMVTGLFSISQGWSREVTEFFL